MILRDPRRQRQPTADGLEQRHYGQHEANFNVTAITDPTDTVVERLPLRPLRTVAFICFSVEGQYKSACAENIIDECPINDMNHFLEGDMLGLASCAVAAMAAFPVMAQAVFNLSQPSNYLLCSQTQASADS